MRVVLQRVSHASVTVEEKVIGQIQRGFLLLVGVTHDDAMEDMEYPVRKIVQMRIFEDEESMDLLILDVIKEYELKENFVIRVNPIYKESLDKQILELKENNLINKDVFILSDESVDKGNALIESLNGKLVIGIDDVIGKIKEELL